MSAVLASEPAVLRLQDGWSGPLRHLLARFSLEMCEVAPGEEIPHSYWGDSEAGLECSRVWVRDDTPVHSVLHECSHAICMGGARRAALLRDAGGDHDEENAVCCLQILLAEALPGLGAERLMEDMDRWGYTFRLGSTRAWFEQESHEARRWLEVHGVLDTVGQLTGRMRL